MISKPHVLGSLLVIGLSAVVLFSATPAQAQLEELVGERVRLTHQFSPGTRMSTTTGVLTNVSADSLILSMEGRDVEIPRTYIRRVEVSTSSRRATGYGALVGMAVGGLGLGALAVATNEPNDCMDTWFCIEFTSGQAFLIGAVPGALLGAGLGALIGHNTKADRWQAVNVDVVAIRAGGTIGRTPPGLRLVVRI